MFEQNNYESVPASKVLTNARSLSHMEEDAGPALLVLAKKSVLKLQQWQIASSYHRHSKLTNQR